MNKAKQTVSEQIGRLGLNLPDHAVATPAPVGRWAKITATIVAFQQKYNGQSPGNPHIAHVLGLSPGQVQHALSEMEAYGVIVDKPGWPRRLIVKCSVQSAEQADKHRTPAEEDKKAETENVTPVPNKPRAKRRSGKKREAFIVVAKRFAQALTDFYDTHGYAPLINEVGPMLGYSTDKPVGLSRITKEMVERGWLYHKAGFHRDYVLTGLGRAVLFGEMREEMHTDMPVKPAILATPAFPKPVEIRQAPETYNGEASRDWPEKAKTVANFEGTDTIDLVLELQRRGFKIERY